ncbi:hypothetical protein T440DRAFT_281281 [Plenodomus tracheiphilus IPT5]|uniref:Xylanolytic transcriptional activator regulatory domain-containing protein n=1 Tax=Plenodomus tracheiphilus IPT5 TaxID=1408161 RepID=A0A6A7ASM1_9PLEO|nr:hypothetical protein T440DRAFT_281281 [Plenodomus tracheiphilus IPT5]
MSSIKQVQDLQSQIAELTQVNSQLRTKLPEKDALDVERTDMKRRHSGAPVAIAPALHRAPKPRLNNFAHVRNNIQRHAEDLFDIPYKVRSKHARQSSSQVPELPSRADFAHLSRAYLDCIHGWHPILHWPTFQSEVDEVYTKRTLERSPPEWIGLFFAVLACASLQLDIQIDHHLNTPGRGLVYFDIASKALTPWPEDFTLSHAQSALLLSIYAAESNMKSLGSIWLASAVRIAQELQIHVAVDALSPLEDEARRRLWWAIYSRDRTMALETNKPALIHELDCEIPLPSALEDRYIQSQGVFRSQASPAPSTGSLAVIQITRMYAGILQTLRSSVIHHQALQNHDEQFRSSMALLPESYQPGSNAIFEAAALPTVFTILTARFHLYRRNLTIISHPAERAEALDRCVTVAKDTAKYVSRALHNTSRLEAAKSWHARVAPIASNTVCLHLWRCILILCLRGEYDAALMCLHLSSTIGHTRKINSACGKHIAFFVDGLLDRQRKIPDQSQRPEHDEELLAYASADAQGSIEHSWVWTGANASSKTSPQLSPCSITRRQGHDETMHDVLPLRGSFNSLDPKETPWNEWGRIESTIRQLMEESRPRTAQTPTYYLPPHNPVKRVQLAPDDRLPPKPSTSSTPTPSSASRISIANII